jgi:serine phosphatase RsbU (regulator of sigma subunit)/anti-sigma regulatory factor (Ser/Thr protein kinase)
MNAFWQKVRTNKGKAAELPEPMPEIFDYDPAQVEELNFNQDDQFVAYLLKNASAVEIDNLTINSPMLERLRSKGIKITVPLVSQGELVGLINLGPRRSEQDYSSDDRRLLNNLATQAAPALRVAQIARQQQAEALERERIETELRVARVIQQTLLPKETPKLAGWEINALWQPAREVSGDFYDFIELPDGKMGILIADVTDKGVPAALVMATARSLLRTAAERLYDPSQVLKRSNDLLHPDIPPKMFVTCLYTVLDPVTGKMVFANAGHNLPYHRTSSGVVEPRATGMPLGLMPGMDYNEIEITLEPGDTILLTSDGIIEAHNHHREMFGLERAKSIVKNHRDGLNLIEELMNGLRGFTGDLYEQEDDITLVTITRNVPEEIVNALPGFQLIKMFELPSEPGNERQAASQVLDSVSNFSFSDRRLKQLETAVAEATMNALEHGNHYKPELLVTIQVLTNGDELVVRIIDQGGDGKMADPITPDLEAKLSGLQSPRGWGLFLIQNMVDEMRTHNEPPHHIIELVFKLKENTE